MKSGRCLQLWCSVLLASICQQVWAYAVVDPHLVLGRWKSGFLFGADVKDVFWKGLLDLLHPVDLL